MQKDIYYILRLFPPIGDLRKFRFSSLDTLLETVHSLYQTLHVESLDLTDAQKDYWRKNPLDMFTDNILITCIYPDTEVNHLKLFKSQEIARNLSLKRKIRHIEPIEEIEPLTVNQ